MSGKLTEKVIKDTFLKLISERPLEKVSVKDIVDECGISRNTFYYHYQDIYILLETIFEEQAELIILSHSEKRSWKEALVASTKFAIENKNAIYHVYNSANRDQLERYLYRVCQEITFEYVKAEAEDLNVLDKDITYIALFYKHAIVGMIFEWLQGGMKDDAEEIIKELGVMFDGSIRELLLKVSLDDTKRNYINI